jgi:hypothetical protein
VLAERPVVDRAVANRRRTMAPTHPRRRPLARR